MKTLILIIGIGLWLTVESRGQVFVDGVNINEQDITYCQLIANNGVILNPTSIYIDYGQRITIGKRPVITGPDRQPIRFSSVMEGLNFMIRNGWELVTSHITSDKDGDIGKFIYLLQKRKPEKSE